MLKGRRGRWMTVAVLLGLAAGLPAAAEDRFTRNGDGTVTDRRQGLMWASTDNQGDIGWKEAGQWIRFTFGSTIPARHEGWRMPTLAELSSLFVDDDAYDGYETECGLRVKVVPEIRLTCGWVWAADSDQVTASVFNFTRGIHYTERKVHHRAHRALAVRDLTP